MLMSVLSAGIRVLLIRALYVEKGVCRVQNDIFG